MENIQWSIPGSTLIWDRTQQVEPSEILYPFALEELLCRQVGEGGAPIVHLWRHPRAFVMGLRDSRLPHAREAKHWLEQQGYSVAVRNSGGAAVPLDLGVVNVSLILPKKQGQIDFRQDFETMYQLIRTSLESTVPEVAKGEIVGSYCPGDYDLSIRGKKFCGIAQRRQSHAFVVQAFVVVTGSGGSHAGLAREFYRIAAHGEEAVSYPEVHEDSMGSLQELAGLKEEHGFIEAVKQTVRKHKLSDGKAGGEPELRLPDEQQVLEMAASLKQRYGIE